MSTAEPQLNATETNPTGSPIVEKHKQYLFPSISNYYSDPLVTDHASMQYVWDTEGKKYLDFVSGIGVNALGYAHPRIVKTIRDQAAKLIHISNLYYHEYQGVLAEKLAQLS